MPTRSRRRKTQAAAETPIDISKTSEIHAANQLPGSGEHHVAEAHAENDEQSSLSPQLTDNSEAGDSQETASRGRASGSDRSTKRQRTKEENSSDSYGEEQPSVKRTKKTKDTQPLPAGQPTTAANEQVPEDHEDILATEDESHMETDNTEIEERYEDVHADTAASPHFESELVMHRTTSHRRQEQALSSEVRSSAESSDIWLSLNTVGDRTNIYSGSTGMEFRQRAMAPKISDKDASEPSQRMLSAYRSGDINRASVQDRIIPESVGQRHKRDCTALCNLLKYFVMTCIIIVSAVLIAMLVSTGGEPYYSQWLASIKEVMNTTAGIVKEDIPVPREIPFKRLQKEFPSQTGRLWRIMESATLPIVEEDAPTHPAVILLVTTQDSHAVAECLAGRYAALVTESLHAATHATFNCEMYADSDPEEAKRQLDAVLSRAFDGGSKSGVVLRLEKLPGSAAMIFYRFADNDNAPYKDVAIVLTLALESADTGSERDSVAYDELRKVWGSSLDTDKVEPLLSRIGNSVAFVRSETRDVLTSLNC